MREKNQILHTLRHDVLDPKRQLAASPFSQRKGYQSDRVRVPDRRRYTAIMGSVLGRTAGYLRLAVRNGAGKFESLLLLPPA